jgi:mannose-6-phosphate isomerase-like protein (cupin superfamily)
MPAAARHCACGSSTRVTVRIAHAHARDASGKSILESLAPHGHGPPVHVHHHDDEAFHVPGGELTLRVGHERPRIGVGETLLAPRGCRTRTASPLRTARGG